MYKCENVLVPVNLISLSVYFFLCTGVVTLTVFVLLFIGKDLSPIPITKYEGRLYCLMYHFHPHISMHIFTELDEFNEFSNKF